MKDDIVAPNTKQSEIDDTSSVRESKETLVKENIYKSGPQKNIIIVASSSENTLRNINNYKAAFGNFDNS